MGQNSSRVEAADVRKRLLADISLKAASCLSEIEKLSLKQHPPEVNKLGEQLGIENFAAEPLVFRSAQFLASWPYLPRDDMEFSSEYLPKIVTLYDGRLRKRLRMPIAIWYTVLFLSLAVPETLDLSNSSHTMSAGDFCLVKNVNVEDYFVRYSDLNDLFTLLVSLYDTDPAQRLPIISTDADVKAAGSFLRLLGGPKVKFGAFERLVRHTSLLWNSLAILFHRLFYAPNELLSKDNAKSCRLPRQLQIGIDVALNTVMKYEDYPLLYSSGRDGFSMMAFEKHVFGWDAPTLLVVRGKRSKSAGELDEIVPPVFDANLRTSTKSLAFAVRLDEPWQLSAHNFGGSSTFLLQLQPDFNKYIPAAKTARVVSFVPSIGIGIGTSELHDLKAHARIITPLGTFLVLDSNFQHGVFRVLDRGLLVSSIEEDVNYEDRFTINSVEIWGLGGNKELMNQKKAFEWHELGRKHHSGDNLIEERALLEMAGLVGSY